MYSFPKMITFAKMLSFMETRTKIQTVIRIRPEVMERVKYQARGNKMSFNAFVESILDQATKVSIPKLSKEIELDPLVKSISGAIPAPTPEMLEQDERLAHLLCK